MNPPAVRTLDQLVAESKSVYDPLIANNNNMIASANTRLGEQQQGLDAAKVNAFGDITQASTRRGALFSGFTADQQARYTAEKYLPALANLRAANEQTIQGINADNLNIRSEQRKTALNTREGDLSKLYDYNKTMSERKWQTEQAEKAYAREMEKLRAEQAFAAAENSKARAATAASNASKSASQSYFTRPGAGGGMNFFDPKGSPITAAQYFSAQGGGIGDVRGFLQQYHPNGGALRDLNSGMKPVDLQKKYPHVFGGV